MKVVKLGGSLITDIDALTICLKSIEKNRVDKIVIVPGGGIFADQVRNTQQQWAFNDQIAHEMALLAMQQMALLFGSINPDYKIIKSIEQIQKALQQHNLVIWSPDIKQLNAFNIEASWDVSSDSLAAWLANTLKATELILVKSTAVAIDADIKMLQSQGVLDAAFFSFVEHASYKIKVLNKNNLKALFDKY